MAFVPIAVLTAFVILTGLSITCTLCLTRRRLHSAGDLGNRLRDVSPYLGAVAFCFLAKRATDGYSLQISHALGWDITDELHAIEGGFIPPSRRPSPE